jgi:osmoprotectant transport system permease protein
MSFCRRALWISTPVLGGLLLLALGCGRSHQDGKPLIRVASKQFPESVLLGDIIGLLAENAGAHVEYLHMLGDTSKTWNGLLTGQLDAYCDYTGTILKETLADKDIQDEEELRRYLKNEYNLFMTRSLGFSNNYALGMREAQAEELGITKISDLRDHSTLRLGLSAPFLERSDGWQGLKRAYRLPFSRPEGKQHDVAYTEISTGGVDVIDVYTTDAKIRLYNLRVLEDDLGFFPAYEAVVLYRADVLDRAPDVVKAWQRLEGSLSREKMLDLNYRVTVEETPELQVARDFLADSLGIEVEVEILTIWDRIVRQSWNHLQLVGVSLFFAILTAIPLGIVAARWHYLGQVILGSVGIVQTLPSFALLTFLLVALSTLRLPGLGFLSAVIALYVYSLLPILRNTYTGITGIPLEIRESAEALGLSSWAQLYLVELPMASRSILAGIKTSSIINVGFATLGGLIGAGGYGQLIFAGLIKNDNSLLMAGAIPAMGLALLFQGVFELAERFLVPRGLLLRSAT